MTSTSERYAEAGMRPPAGQKPTKKISKKPRARRTVKNSQEA